MTDTLLAEHAAEWKTAIGSRRSHRRFEPRAVESATLDGLDELCRAFTPWPDARVVLVREAVDSAFTGIVGSYGKITGAPSALLVIADTSSPSCQHHAGYTGQAAILHATALGLETCWIAGAFSPENAARLTTLSPAEKVLAISPVGHATDLSFTDRSMRLLARSSSRQPIETIAPGAGNGWPAWAREAVEAARMAPSAMNRQPWRFRLEDGALVVARDQAAEVPKVTRALDCGIAMLHAEVGARSAGAAGAWEDLVGDGLDVARYRVEA